MDYLHQNLSGKIIVFTGGTDGMGKVALQKLAAMGAKILLFGRSAAKTNQAISEIKSSSGNTDIHYIPCDLASQQSIRMAAERVTEQCPKIDLLINCAGMNAGERSMTEDQMETTWAVNHLAPFLLNHLLLRPLRATGSARIVNLSSATEKYGRIRLNDIHLEKGWSTFKSYTQAKLAMNMTTRKMAREWAEYGITINALNPGFIKTNLLRQTKGWERLVGVPYMYFCASKPEKGADRILRLALSKEYENISGKFVYEDAIREPNPLALDDSLVEQVWALSRKHVGL